MNCFPSAVGFMKSLVTNPKSSSVEMQWLTSRNSTSPFWWAVQTWGKVSSKPLLMLTKAEVSAHRMLSLHDFDLTIQIMSSINLRKCSVSRSTPAIDCIGYNVQQYLPTRQSACHRLKFSFGVYNWPPYWGTTFFRQILFNSAMMSRALVEFRILI